MRILVTGNAGYIGSVLTGYLLQEGHTVIGVDNLFYSNGYALLSHLGHPNFKFYKLDVQDYFSVNELAKACDVIIPLAALVGAPICERLPDTAVAVNSWSVANLVKSLSKHQRLIFPNTNSGYGQTDGTRSVTEEDPLNPISVYGKSKCEGEQRVLDHQNSIVFRLATVFGVSPRMRADLMVNDFTCRLSELKEVYDRPGRHTYSNFVIYEPHFTRNFVGVRDVSRAFLYAMGDSMACGVYNLGLPPANLTKLELAHAICETIGLDKSFVTEGQGTDPDQRNYKVSNAKLLDTGFKFSQSLRSGIVDVARVYSLCPEMMVRNVS